MLQSVPRRVPDPFAGPFWRRFVPWSVPGALIFAAVLHLIYLSTDLGSDEGGFAMVARHWLEPGSYPYGPQWVDRPPLLIAVFWVADHLGAYGMRLTATAVAVAIVAVLAAAARLAVEDHRASAARWTAWIAAALSSTSLFNAEQLNGELLAALFVSCTLACVLAAVRHPRGALAWMAAGGALAVGAVLVKQNFVDGLAFAAIFLALTAFGRLGLWRAVRLALAFAAGAAVVVAAALVWAHAHGGIEALVYAMYGFRIDAGRVIAVNSQAAAAWRAVKLGELALASGVITLAAGAIASQSHRFRHRQPLPWALLGAFAVELIGIIGGGNFWPHYLIALVPTLALAAGLSTRRDERRSRVVRAAGLLAVVATLAVTPVSAVGAQLGRSTPAQVADWLRHSSHPGDSVAVPFTHANVIGMSGLEPRYPYSWSLPMRTLDPKLRLLVRTLGGNRAPTWVVRWDPPHIWMLDPNGRVARVLELHYRYVAKVCGRAVWLHRGVARTLATSTGGHCHVTRSPGDATSPVSAPG